MGIKQSRHNNKKPLKDLKWPIRPEEKVRQIESYRNSKVKLNIGGVEFISTKNNILNFPFNCCLKEMVAETDEIFIDRSPDNFNLILQMIRDSVLIHHYTKEEIAHHLKHYHCYIKDKLTLTNDFEFYFAEDSQKISQSFNLDSFLKDDDNCNEKIVSFELIGSDQDEKLDYMGYRCHNLDQLTDEHCKKAFFFKPGGALLLEFEKTILIRKIQLQIFNFDKIFWDEKPTCITCYKSDDKQIWHFVSKLTLSYPNKEKIYNLPLINVMQPKFLKLSTEDSNETLSISYIKIC